MKYTGAHAAFFEAALANLPTAILDWLAADLPRVQDSVPTNRGGMILKDSIEWKTLVNRAQPDLLPDFCIYCEHSFEPIPGGQIREGCPECIEEFPSDADSYITPLLRVMLTLQANTDYFHEVSEYLFCCHIAWRQSIEWTEYTVDATNQVAEAKPSLMEKLRG